jgi:hypothetical protein
MSLHCPAGSSRSLYLFGQAFLITPVKSEKYV